ncbi:radical SAM protein [Candidatus Methylomirabilis lanthanidiphila]|uniref:Lipoyl synthase n=1 Tax=Candidatus Methylomirabilis lanthanidiphila TaxID=2211376 RepID=A0A564ZNK2_9BACT|nr:radical SAM protein [Candidatus Methylomirabilis lanthanidiphila]
MLQPVKATPLLSLPEIVGSPKPPWLKVKAPGSPNYLRLKRLVRERQLHTICEEALCPNIGECWQQLTATFLILGEICTRNCGFCAATHGRPTELDMAEPDRVATAICELGLAHAVITSVNRDDLADGGAQIFAAVIRQIRERSPDCSIEVLVPDFRGSEVALRTVVDAAPTILSHNMETIPRLYQEVRLGSDYERSIELLATARRIAPEIITKSGIIVGFGEVWPELLRTMADLREADCDILTLGQYLRPSQAHVPIRKYYTPEEFRELKVIGEEMGFKYVESGPLVRSSYHARGQAEEVSRKRESGRTELCRS